MTIPRPVRSSSSLSGPLRPLSTGLCRLVLPRDRAPRAWCGWSDDAGAVTAEYAVATLAAVGFAGVLVVVLRSDEVRTVLLDLIRGALAGG
jgi:hypothetical protein